MSDYLYNTSMRILAIDTSCDDTSAAVTEGAVVLSNVVSSQYDVHQEWGGVVPMLAKRAHQEKIDGVVEKALKLARTSFKEIDAIAVTIGPGLSIALEVGMEKAKQLATQHHKKLVAVNHMEGHLYASFAQQQSKNRSQIAQTNPVFPALVLLVSGGHTELVLMKSHGAYELIGETLDDAVGEAFDKVARMLGLGYPGGAVLARFAKNGNDRTFPFPMPLTQKKEYMFSYSGLKTAAMRHIEVLAHNGKSFTKQQISDFAASFQRIAIAHLIRQTTRAVETYQPKSIIVGGGVSANLLLRKHIRSLARAKNILCFFPRTKKLASDNAAMIGVAAFFKAQREVFVTDQTKLDRDPTLPIDGSIAGEQENK